MNNTDKVRRLQELNEAALRQQVLIPLLGRMGYKAAFEHHGAREHGKDIVCFDTHKLGGRKYLAIVAKIGDLTGSVSSAAGLSEILNQVEQCFNEKYPDLFGMKMVTMDEVWVVTAGRIVTGAGDTVAGRLEKQNLTKLVHFISGEQLVHLIDEHYPSYWSQEGETLDTVREQRDRAVRFVSDVMKKLGATDSQTEEVVAQLLHSSWTPRIHHVKEMRLIRGGSYEVVVGPSSYIKGLVSDQCGDIADALKGAQEKVRSALYDLEDTIETAGKAIVQSEPWEFVRLFEKIDRPRNRFRNDMLLGKDAFSAFQLLVDGLHELDRTLEALRAAGKLDYFLAVVASLESLRDDVEQYLQHMDSAKFTLNWSVGDESEPNVRLLYETPSEPAREAFSTTYERDVKVSHGSERTRRTTASEVLERAQMTLKALFEKKFRRNDQGPA